jgi:hypothetical protein
MLSDKAYLFLTAVASVIIFVVMVMVGVPWWLGLVICVPVVVGGLIVKRQLDNKRPYEVPSQVLYQPPPPPPQPIPPASTSVQGLALPSADRDYRFLLNATILWRPSGAQGAGRPELAIDAVRERATRFTEGAAAADSDLLAPRLAAELSFSRPDRTGQLEVWAHDVVLSIADDDRRRLRKLAEIRKDEEVWEHERSYERSKRTYLREDVLQSTGSAVVWWLAQNSTRVEETVGLIGTLAKLVAAAQGREVEPVFRMFVDGLTGRSSPTYDDGIVSDVVNGGTEVDALERLMAEMLPSGSEPERADLADRLARLAAEAGADDLAHRIRERFNAPDFTEVPEPEPSPFDGKPSAEDTPSPVHPNGQTEPGNSGTPPRPPF